jgi:tripartite-type tricarboxylate transporter receptor subunit TctC
MKRFLVLALSLVAFGAAHAQQRWPMGAPVRVLVANSPGTVTDVAARVFSEGLARGTGGNVVVENRPGADGYIAAQATASAAPDGYTLFFASQSIFGIDPWIKKSMPVDPDRDFTHIATMVDESGATGIYAYPGAPFNTLPEMVAYAKANPGKLSFASIVPIFSMIGAWLNKRAGIEILEIKYKAAPQAYQDVMGGRVPILLDAFGSMEPHIKAGKLKVIALTKPMEDYPQYPVFSQLWPDYRQPSFIVLVGPAKMAPALTEQINRAAASVVQNPKFNADLVKMRWKNVGGARTPQETSALILRGRAEWGAFVKTAGVQPE